MKFIKQFDIQTNQRQSCLTVQVMKSAIYPGTPSALLA